VLENHGSAIRAAAEDLEVMEGTGVEDTGWGADDERERIAFVLRALVDRALTDLAEAGRFEAVDEAG